MKADTYEVSDSLWGRVTQYASAVKDAWDKDADTYVDKVMKTDARSDDELYGSTVLQDAGHSVAFAWHLLGSVVSNEYTQERAKELGTALSQTEGYGSAKETITELHEAMNEATTEFMQAHPKVYDALQEIGNDANRAIDIISDEAKAFAKNHPEISHDFQALVEVASSVPAAKAGKVAMRASEEVQLVDTLQYLDKAHKHPIEIGTPTREDLEAWQAISKTDKSAAGSWIWENSFAKGVKNAVQTKSLESLKSDIGVQAGLSRVLGQKPEFVQISTNGKPLGMMLMAKDYKTHITEGNTGFVWYLQSTPKDYLENTLKLDKNEFDIKPGAALLDSAAVKSLESGKTDVMLHADPAGGDGLVGYYGSQKYRQVGQEIDGENVPNITGVGTLGRENDGRYFHQDYESIESYLEKNRDKVGQTYDLRREETPLTFNKTDMALGSASAVAIANDTPFDPTTHAQNLINNLYPHLAPTQASSESARELYEDMATTPYVPTDTQSTVETSVTDFSPQLQNYLDQFAPQDTQGYDSNYDMGMEIE